jgi:hypothetical protein
MNFIFMKKYLFFKKKLIFLFNTNLSEKIFVKNKKIDKNFEFK